MTVEVWRRSRLHPLEEVGGEVAFGERRQDDDDQLAGHLGPRADLEGGGQRGAGRDADGQALDRRGRPRGAERGVVADAHDLVDQRGLEIVRHEAGADALDLVRAGLAAGEHGAVLGLDGNHPQPRLARLQRLADAGQRAAGADGGDDDVDAAGSVAPDLPRWWAAVDFRVGPTGHAPGW